jgi:hypothetical protein
MSTVCWIGLDTASTRCALQAGDRTVHAFAGQGLAFSA